MKKVCFARASAFALLASVTSVVSAASIPVVNASFEAQALGPGGWSDQTPPGWTEPVPDGGDSFTEYLSPNFIPLDGLNHQGIQNRSWIAQNLGVPVTPYTDYYLTVDVGRRNASFTAAGNQSRYELWAGAPGAVGSVLLAGNTYDAFPLPDLTMVEDTAFGSTGGAVPVGNLWVWLGVLSADRAHFDNVRVDAFTNIPEPSSITLLGLGGAILYGMARRRRRK